MQRAAPPPFTKEILALARAFVLIFGLVIVSAAYWAVFGPDTILNRADNPRSVDAAAMLRRGAIFDRDGNLLALSQDQDGQTVRRYFIPTTYSAVGYSSRIHGSGGFGKWLVQLARTEVLVLDDWGVASLDPNTRSDLLEIIDDRAAHKATVITTQLPVEHWHAWIGDATIADAILDRVLQRVHRVDLGGESLRKPPPSPNTKKAPAKERSSDPAN